MIRSATREDLERVLAVWEAAADASATDDLPALETLFARDREALLVAELGRELVGTLVTGWDGWRGTLYRLAVAETARRRGIGTALVAEGERRLRAQGARRVQIMVYADNDAACGFWEAVGYSEHAGVARYVKAL